jgi:tetratricopeptide (TPR) repeat protein
MKVSFFETGRYSVPSDIPREWPVPSGAYDPAVGAKAYQGMVERDKGDSARAMAAFRECREILAQRLLVRPNHARTIAVLAQTDASLGQRDLALKEAQRAMELMPVSQDIYDGGLVLEGVAQVYTWLGDRDRAIETIQKLLSMPSYINYGRLKVHPLWAPLRKDPRLQKIIAEQAPR